jgi:hypothetical protein
MKGFLEEINHPVLFLLFLVLAINGFNAVATHVSKRLGWSGPASFFQHP